MAKNKEVDFESMDYDDFGSEFNFDDDFDAEPGSVPSDRSPMGIAKYAMSGAIDHVTDTNNIKQFMKSALPSDYGNAFALADTVGDLGNKIYGDVARELRPLTQEVKKVAKKAMPILKGIMPDSLAERLDDFLSERERNDGPSQEEMMETSIQGTLAEIFKAQAEQQDEAAKKETVDREVKNAVDMKYQNDSLVSLSGMTVELKKLTSYQENITINWQRKTLELQLRQFFIQKESLEEQKKINAIIQTNLEGILKNTSLPDYLKLTRTESVKQQLRVRASNAIINGVANSKPVEWIRNVGKNVGAATKKKVTELKDEFVNILGMIDQGLETAEIASDTGQDPVELVANMMGGSAAAKILAKAVVPLRERLNKKQGIVKFGRWVNNRIMNIPAYMKKNAAEGRFEDKGFGLGKVAEILNESVRMADNKDTIVGYNHEDVDAPAIFDNKVKRSIVDVIPGYLSQILQTNQQLLSTQIEIAGAHGIDAEDKVDSKGNVTALGLKSRNGKIDTKLWDWELNKFRNRNAIRSDIGRKLTDHESRYKAEEEMTKIINDQINYVNEDLDPEDGYKYIDMTEEMKVKLANQLIRNQMNNVPLDENTVAQMQKMEYWDELGVYSKEEKEQFANWFLSLGISKKDLKKVKGYGPEALKKHLENITKGNGVHLGKVNKLIKSVGEATSHIRNKEDVLQEIVNLYGPEVWEKIRGITPTGQVDEEASVDANNFMKQTRYDPNDDEVDEVKRWLSVPNLSKKTRKMINEYIEATAQLNLINKNGPARPEESKPLKEKVMRLRGIITSELNKAGNSFANGGVVRTRYFAEGGKVEEDNVIHVDSAGTAYTGGYTGDGAKWQEADAKVHAGEVVFSQDDVERMGGVENVEAIRKGGLGIFSKLKGLFGDKELDEAKDAIERRKILNERNKSERDIQAERLRMERKRDRNRLKQTRENTIEENVARITAILQKGIPLGKFVEFAGKGGDDNIPWYMRSIGSVMSDLAAIPFKAAAGGVNLTTKAFKLGGGFLAGAGELIFKGLEKAKEEGKKVKTAVSEFAAEQLDKMDVWVKGEGKARLSAILLKAGEYYNAKGEKITSWGQLKDPIFQYQDGVLTKVFDPSEIKDAFIYNYETGKNFLLSGVKNLGKFAFNRAKDIYSGAGFIGTIAAEVGKAVKDEIRNILYAPTDVYVKGKIKEGPRLYATLMEKGYYVLKEDPSKIIHTPADITGEVLDKNGNIVLSIQDIKDGLCNIEGKPLRVGMGKIVGFAADVAKLGFGTVNSIFKGAKGVGSLLLGGLGGLMTHLFGDSGVVFTNSSKMLDKLDQIYNVLNDRLPGAKKVAKHDTDGDGDVDGSSKDLAEKNAEARKKAKEESEAKLKAAKELAKERMDKLKGLLSGNPLKRLKELFLGKDDEEEEDGDSDTDIDIDIDSDDDTDDRRRRRKDRKGRKDKTRRRGPGKRKKNHYRGRKPGPRTKPRTKTKVPKAGKGGLLRRFGSKVAEKAGGLFKRAPKAEQVNKAAEAGKAIKKGGILSKIPGRGLLNKAGTFLGKGGAAAAAGEVAQTAGASAGLGTKIGGGLLRAGMTGMKGVGLGMAASMAGSAAHAAGYDTLGTVLDTAGTAATVYSGASMLTSAMGMGSLGSIIGSTGVGAALSSAGGAVAGAAATAGTAISGALSTAGAFLLTNPVGWGILAAAALAGIGYAAYKYFKSGDLDKFGDYRYVQYGFDPDDDDWEREIKNIEEFFEENHLKRSNGQVTLDDSQVDFKKFFDLFDTDLEDKEQCLRVLNWYNQRFKPVFLNAANALEKIKPGTKMQEIEDKLSASEQLRYLTAAQLPQGPYDRFESPFSDLGKLPSGPDEVKAAYDKLYAEVKEEADKEAGDGKSSNGIADTVKKAAMLSPAGLAYTAGKSLLGDDKEKSPDGKTDSGTAMDTVKKAAMMSPAGLAYKAGKAIAGATVPTAAAATAGATVITSNTNVETPGSSGANIPALRAIRYKTYGLTDFSADRVYSISSLEKYVLEYVKITPDKQAQFEGSSEAIAGETASLFSINEKDAETIMQYKHYLEARFIPVLLSQVSACHKATSKQDVFQCITDDYKPEISIAIAKAVVGTKTDNGIVWLLGYGLWKGYKLNTEPSSTDPHLDAIKKQLKDQKLKAEEDRQTAQTVAEVKDGKPMTQAEKDRAQREADKKIKNDNETNKKTETSFLGNLKNAASGWWDAAKNAGGNFMSWLKGEKTGEQAWNDTKQGIDQAVTITGASLSGSNKEKYRKIRDAAIAAGDPHPDVVAAQWALESSWGKKESGKFNYFGIKAKGNEAGTVRRTREVLGGQNVYINDKFKDYASLEEGIKGRVDFIKNNKRYTKSGYFSAQTPYEAAAALQRGGYATDPNYANALSKIIKGAGFDPMKKDDLQSSGTGSTPADAAKKEDEYRKKMQGITLARNTVMNNKSLTADQKKSAMAAYDKAAANLQKEYTSSNNTNGRKEIDSKTVYEGKGASNSSVPWMDIAKSLIGRNEKDDAVLIREMHNTTNCKGCDGRVPWCASFVNYVLSKAGIKGTGSASAASYKDYGNAAQPGTFPYGAILVIRFGKGNHVSFCAGTDGDRVLSLGGNQSSKKKGDQRNGGEVTISRIPKSNVIAVRLPVGYNGQAVAPGYTPDSSSSSSSSSPSTNTGSTYTPPARRLKTWSSNSDKDSSSEPNDPWAAYTNSPAFIRKDTYEPAKNKETDPDTKEDNATVGTTKVGTDTKAYKAAKYAASRAGAKSQGRCARFVADALVAGGYKFTRQVSAFMYASNKVLEGAGFKQISMKSPRQIGDVIVWSAYGGSKGGGKHGHIQIYTEKGWCSDFIQRDEAPGPSYRSGKSTPTLWRDAEVMGERNFGTGEATGANAGGGLPKDSPGYNGLSTNVGQGQNTNPYSPQSTQSTADKSAFESLQALNGYDSVAAETKALQKDAIRAAEDKRNNNITDILVSSNKEHKQTNALLSKIYESLTGTKVGKLNETDTVSATAPLDKPKKDDKPKKLNRAEAMSQGVLKVKKTVY